MLLKIENSSKELLVQVKKILKVRFGDVLLAVYVILIVGKKSLGYADGVVDVVLLAMLLFFLVLRLIGSRQNLSDFQGLPSFKVFLMLSVYYWVLATISFNTIELILLEYISVLKWYIYYVIGFILAQVVIRSEEYDLITPSAWLTLSLLVLGYSLVFYDWSNAFFHGLLSFETFYHNSFESIFSYRSVFSLFGLSVFLFAINEKNGFIRLALLINGLLFVYMSGNRKALAAVILVMVFYKIYSKYRKVFNAYRVLLVLIICLSILYSTLGETTRKEYTNLDQPRVYTYIKAVEIFIDRFPIGSGPATFASSGSMKNYSPIYEQYGMVDKWGFGKDDPVHFHMDTYWAKIIGQYGAIGVGLFLFLLYTVSREAMVARKRYRHISPPIIMFILLVLSTVTPLFQRTEIGLFIMAPLGLTVGSMKKREKDR